MQPYYHFLFMMLLGFSAHSSSAQNYFEYHTNIIKAEQQIFVEEHFNEGLETYLNTFNRYDFVFLNDCMTALQIALHAEDENAFLKIANKATQNGLMPRHLLKMAYINKHPIYQKYKDSIISMYKINRTHYLKRIDTAALKKMYHLYAMDQLVKNRGQNESNADYNSRYSQQIKETFKNFQALTHQHGWPSDKVMGIYQSDIMKELQIAQPDMIDYYYKYKDQYNIREGQFQEDETDFCQSFFWAVLAHYGHHISYQYYNDDFYLEQIKKGNIHPDDLGYLIDFKHWNSNKETILAAANKV